MEIQELWRIILARWRVVVMVILICVALSLAWSWAGPVKYRAQGRIVISTSGSLGTANDAYSGEQVAVERAPTYAQLLRGPEVAARASKKLQGAISPETIQRSVDAKIHSRMPMLDITATAPSARDAILMVAAEELGLQQYVSEIERPGRDGSLTGVALTGDIPTITRLGSPVRNAVLAGLLGVVLGTLLAVYRDRTDPIVRGAGQLAGCGLRYRGTIAADDDPPAVTDAFRRLAVGCMVTEERHVGRILVAGVDEGGCDGLYIAAGLARGLAACGRRVTLVDAVSGESLRQRGGFSDVVDGSCGWSECRVRNGSDHLWQMDIGTNGESLDALLINGTNAKRRLPISGAQEHIIIAAPSITHTALAVALTAVADAALVVVKERASHVSDVFEAKRTLDAMGIAVMGMVLVSGTAGREQINQLRDHCVDSTSSPNGEVRSTAGKA